MGQKEQTKAVAQVTKRKVDPANFGWAQFTHMHGPASLNLSQDKSLL